jgi:lipopolysaccharide export LptBFGC system permease protein LptF
MKKFILVLVVLVLGVFTTAAAFADGDVMYVDSYSATISTMKANVRVEPDEFAKKIQTFKYGDMFTVIGEHDNGAINNNWYIISCGNGDIGYIRKFVTVLNPRKLVSTSEALYVFTDNEFTQLAAEFATRTEFLIIKESKEGYFNVSLREGAGAGFIQKDNPDIFIEEFTGK